MSAEYENVPEFVGEWEPRRRPEVALPENLPREVRRLVWYLQDIGCIRSPFIGHRYCYEIEDMPFVEMCSSCRALRPYRKASA